MIKKYLAICSSFAISAIPFLTLSIESKIQNNLESIKSTSDFNAPLKKPKMWIYDNKIFYNKDKIISHYLKTHPKAIRTKNVIGNVKKAIIDFDYNILNKKKLPEFNPAVIYPIYWTASREEAKDFHSAKQSQINPAFTRRSYTDGFGNFYDYKEAAKNSFAKHLVSGVMGLQEIYLLDGKKSHYNPLSVNDYNSYFLNALKSLKEYQSKQLHLPSNYQRTYFNADNQEAKSISDILQNPDLIKLFNDEENKEFDQYLQMKNTRSLANKHELLVAEELSNLDLQNGQNLSRFNFILTSLKNNLVQKQSEYVQSMLQQKDDNNKKIAKLNQKISDINNNIKRIKKYISENKIKLIDSNDVKKILGKSDAYFSSNFSKKKDHYIQNTTAILDSDNAANAKIRFYSGSNPTSSNGFRLHDEFAGGYDWELHNNTYSFYQPLEITHLSDISVIFNFGNYNWWRERKKFQDSRLAYFHDFFVDLKREARAQKNKLLKEYERKYDKKIKKSYNFKIFINSIHIKNIGYRVSSKGLWDPNDVYACEFRFKDITFNWHFTLIIENDIQKDLNKIFNYENELKDKEVEIKAKESRNQQLAKEIKSNKIYVNSLGVPIPFKEIKNINNIISQESSSLNGTFNHSTKEFALSYEKFKRMVNNDNVANKNVIQANIANSNNLYLWVQDKSNLNKEGLYKINLAEIANQNIFSLMDKVSDKNNIELVFSFKGSILSNGLVSGIKIYWRLKKSYPKFKNTINPPQKLGFNQIKNLDISKDYLFFKIQKKVKGFANIHESSKRLDDLFIFLNNYRKTIKEVVTYNGLPILRTMRDNHETIKDVTPYSQESDIYGTKELFSVIKGGQRLHNAYINNHLEEFKKLLRIAVFKDNIKPGFETAAYSYLFTLQQYIKKTSIIGQLPKRLNFKLPEKISNFNLFASTPIVQKEYWVLNQYIFNGSVLSSSGLDHIQATNLYDSSDKNQMILMENHKKEHTQYFNPPKVSRLYDSNGKEVVADSSGYAMYDSLEIIIENARLGILPKRDYNRVFYGTRHQPLENIVSNIYVLTFDNEEYYFMDYDSLVSFLASKITPSVKVYEREGI